MIYSHFDHGKPAAAIRSRMLENGNGLNMHVLEAGFESAQRPCVMLLHGFPELAYSWRKVLPALAAAGFHAIAPDQRGYGRTSGWDSRYDGDLGSFHLLNLVKDRRALVTALGVGSVAAVIGHDFGSPSAADVAACTWLPDDELHVYSSEFSRTSFQGGLQWYRNMTEADGVAQLQRFFGRRIEVPCCFIAGKSDWGPYQSPGALQAMESSACGRYRGSHFIAGAGHWVQQEQPAAVSELLIQFLAEAG
jgi:pimeloyl-ACP methyl ester carboxylesterase